ncbi:unnamed protein product, partial [marine sediment metagenome]
KVKKLSKRKKPLTCKKCNKKFSHSAKSHPLGRLRKHIKKEHPDYHKAIIRKAKKTRNKESQLDRELQFTDDMIVQSLVDAGIPLHVPRQAPMLDPYAPTQHQSITGALITAYKVGQTAYTAIKGAKAISKAVKKRKARK